MTHAALARRTLELEGRVSKLNERADRADELVAMLVELRAQARDRGDYRTADSIRRSLGQLGLELRDNPDGSTSYRPGSGEAGG
jgi:cysteinyl-tRNA synthetase